MLMEYKSNNLTFKWLTGILVSIVVLGVGAFVSIRSHRVWAVEQRVNEVASTVGGIVERTTKVETRTDSFELRLQRIENKIDRLLERQ